MRKLFALLLVVTMVAGVMLPLASSLDAAGNVSGKVIDGNGEAIDGVDVEIFDSNGTMKDDLTTGADGTFSFTDLGSADLRLKITYADHVVSYCSLGKADDDGMYPMDTSADISGVMVIMETGDVDVTFHIIKEDGKGLSGVDVTVKGSDLSVPAEAGSTDAMGYVTFTLDRTDVYTIMFVKDPYSVYATPNMTVSENGDCKLDLIDLLGPAVTVDVLMAKSYVTVKGTVTNTDGGVLGEVIVVFKSADGVERRTSTNRGEYTFEQMLIGEYEVTVSRSDYKTYTETVEVKKIGDDANVIDFELETARDTYLFGLDLPHSLMIGGVIIGILVIAIVSIYRYNLGRKNSTDTPNDVADILEQDDE